MSLQRLALIGLVFGLSMLNSHESDAGTRHSRGRSRPIFSADRPTMFGPTYAEIAARNIAGPSRNVVFGSVGSPSATCCVPVATGCVPRPGIAARDAGFAKP